MRALALVSALLLARALTAEAGFTTPDLVLANATGAEASGIRSAAVEGNFDFPNAVQADYALELVVFQGTRFVRYPVAAAPVTGESAALGDGTLTAAELPAFRQEGAPAAAGVRIVTLTATAIRVQLPATFTAGPVTALLFAILPPPDDSVFSNAVLFTLP